MKVTQDSGFSGLMGVGRIKDLDGPAKPDPKPTGKPKGGKKK